MLLGADDQNRSFSVQVQDGIKVEFVYYVNNKSRTLFSLSLCTDEDAVKLYLVLVCCDKLLRLFTNSNIRVNRPRTWSCTISNTHTFYF